MKSQRKYQPSNGTEAGYFIDYHCMQCKNCDPDPSGDKQCEIFANAVAYSIQDPEYPSEWVYNEKGIPVCTKYSFWDWKFGDPDDPENPNYIPPHNPNQLILFEE